MLQDFCRKKQPPGALWAAGRERGCAGGAPTPVPPPSTAPRRPPRARRDTPPGGGGRSASGRLRASSRFGGWGVSAPPAGRGAHSIVLVPHPVKQPPPLPPGPRGAFRSAPRERTCTVGPGRCSPRRKPRIDPGKVCAGKQDGRTRAGAGVSTNGSPHPARLRLAEPAQETGSSTAGLRSGPPQRTKASLSTDVDEKAAPRDAASPPRTAASRRRSREAPAERAWAARPRPGRRRWRSRCWCAAPGR